MRRTSAMIVAASLVAPFVSLQVPASSPVGAVAPSPVVSAGGWHSAVVRSDGSLLTFGSGGCGELGNRVTDPLAVNPDPRIVDGLTGVTSVAAGASQTLVVRSDGSVWTFGCNTYGQLGRTGNLGAGLPNASPQPVAGIADARAVTAGVARSFVVTGGGALWAFGTNFYGELGIPATSGTGINATPSLVPLANVVAVAAGEFHTLALRGDGTVWGFGDNQFGQLGTTINNGTFGANPTPTQVPGLSSIVAVAAGATFSLALRSDGTVWSFGRNYYGELGNTTNLGQSVANPTPTPIAGLSDIVAIAAGDKHGLALRANGTVWGFGNGGFGQLGVTPDPAQPDIAHPQPSQVATLAGVTAISAGRDQTLAMSSDGVVWAFGDNVFGQLGVGGAGVLLGVPAPVRLPARFVGLTPTRVLDTRPASAVNYSGPIPGGLGAIVRLHLPHGVVPATATAITGNLTATQAVQSNYMQVGDRISGIWSNINIEHDDQTIANAVTVPIAADGSIELLALQPAHLVLDVTGYFVPTVSATSGGRFVAVTPSRVFDTRPVTAVNYSGSQPAARSVTRVAIAGRGPVPPSGASAVVLTVTATDAAAAGYIQVAPAGSLVPGASSNINLEQRGQTLPNQVIVGLGDSGAIDVYAQSGADLIVDIAGYITDDTAPPSTAGLFVPTTPGRVLDTRAAAVNSPPLNAGAVVTVDVSRHPQMPASGVAAVVANITITESRAPGFVQAAATGTLVPGASSIVNASRAGQTIPSAATIPVANNRFDLFTQTGGHLVADIFGYFTT